MATEFDVAVLGCGMAGAAAAIAAAQRGARVCIITGPPGASALFSGAWHGPVVDPVRASLAAVGYEIHVAAAPLQLPHPNGMIVRAEAAPNTHAHAQLGADTVVIGIAGLPGFDADALAKRWSVNSSHTMHIELTPPAGWAPASLATWLDRHPDAIARPLHKAINQTQAKHAILPAVLGLQHDGALHARLQGEADCMISEALATPPSLVGWRLQVALLMALRATRVAVFEDKAHASRTAHGRVEQVTLLNGDVVSARTFVLATGKYASGGIEANGAFREPVLDCPVWVDHLGDTFTDVDSLLLTDPVRTEDQPLMRAGVHTDAAHKPINRVGDIVYENIFVAGSIRAGWSVATHGIGHAAEDGWAAGLAALGERGSVRA